jgi:hypothetical protein
MSFTEVIRFLASHKPHKTNNYKLKSRRSRAGTTSPYEKLRSVDLVPFQGPGMSVQLPQAICKPWTLPCWVACISDVPTGGNIQTLTLHLEQPSYLTVFSKSAFDYPVSTVKVYIRRHRCRTWRSLFCYGFRIKYGCLIVSKSCRPRRVYVLGVHSCILESDWRLTDTFKSATRTVFVAPESGRVFGIGCRWHDWQRLWHRDGTVWASIEGIWPYHLSCGAELWQVAVQRRQLNLRRVWLARISRYILGGRTREYYWEIFVPQGLNIQSS